MPLYVGFMVPKGQPPTAAPAQIRRRVAEDFTKARIDMNNDDTIAVILV
jgi:hypothetical protein